MIHFLKIFTLFAGLALLLASCLSGGKKTPDNLAPNAHQVKAEEVIQTSNYTYVRVSDNDRDYWMAIDKMDVKEGETYYWSNGANMKDFTSKELKRTFRDILFVSDFTDQPILLEPKMTPATTTGRQQIAEQPGIKVEKPVGGITISELFTNKSSYNGKTVKIAGMVVKFSGGIMDRNWVHLQDGTKSGNSYDLTITTKDTVNSGDRVIFEGIISIDKDFGSGYFYDVIMENGHVVNK